jgi:hypothetical protein
MFATWEHGNGHQGVEVGWEGGGDVLLGEKVGGLLCVLKAYTQEARWTKPRRAKARIFSWALWSVGRVLSELGFFSWW